MGTKVATEVRVGNVLRIEGVAAKVIFQEIRGTGKFGKTIHLRLKGLGDGHMIEKSVRAEEKMEDIEVRHVHLQYLYRDGKQFIFMNNETFEQFPISAGAIGKQEIFLKENTDVQAIYIGEQPVAIDFPKAAELKVVSAPPGVRGQADTTYKEAELENGLKILVPQFIREGEVVRVNTEDFSYLDRVTVKSLKSGPSPQGQEASKEKKPPA